MVMPSKSFPLLGLDCNNRCGGADLMSEGVPMGNDPADDENEPVTGAEPEEDAQEPEQRTPPPRVGAIPDSVVFVQPPPVT
ncbi:hypothetical protein AB0M22_21130 [Nocardia sp. NPDC051756]|uniref:hypothetical protein n=1 Tax=Nocardia sp. NPDC051756 TaxID=3154751 RepID=UPI0034334AA9